MRPNKRFTALFRLKYACDLLGISWPPDRPMWVEFRKPPAPGVHWMDDRTRTCMRCGLSELEIHADKRYTCQ